MDRLIEPWLMKNVFLCVEGGGGDEQFKKAKKINLNI